MQITQACKIIRGCSDAIASRADPLPCAEVPLALATLKRYLEAARGDGKSIDELLISESVLLTPQGMRWIMPYVTSAEAIETTRVRRHAG